MFGTVPFEDLERHVARTFSFLYGPFRVEKKLSVAVRDHDLYGFVVQLNGLVVTVK